jgi:phosphoglycolate phosphatase-like HAD superfamily hydrolase/ADP-ribose pyrophosphatase YjhB (NUDIX family)
MVMKLSGLIFDWDGTLADTLPVCFAAFRRALGEFTGKYYKNSDVEKLFGPSEDGCIKLAVGDRWQEAFDLYLEEYEHVHALCPEPAPGILQALDTLKKAGIKLAIVTGKSRPSADISLRRLSMAEMFDAIETGSMDGCFKAESIAKILDEWKVPASEVAYVGDMVADVLESRKVGVLPLTAAWFDTVHHDEVLQTKPEAIFKSVDEMMDWLQRNTDFNSAATPAGETPSENRWTDWAQRIEAIAQNGLTFAANEYDSARYAKLREIAAEIVSAHTDIRPTEAIEIFKHEAGYTTPKVDVRGIVFRDDEILMVREISDEGRWTVPGGWADIGDSPSSAVEREIWEESGYEARATKVLAVYDRNKHGHIPHMHHIYKLFFLCELTGGEPKTSVETSEIRFFKESEIPENLSVGRITRNQIMRFFEHHRNPSMQTDFD